MLSLKLNCTRVRLEPDKYHLALTSNTSGLCVIVWLLKHDKYTRVKFNWSKHGICKIILTLFKSTYLRSFIWSTEWQNVFKSIHLDLPVDLPRWWKNFLFSLYSDSYVKFPGRKYRARRGNWAVRWWTIMQLLHPHHDTPQEMFTHRVLVNN